MAIIAIKVSFTLIIIIQLALTGYSLTTHINLGSDLLGYSLNDIYTTVTSSLSISFVMFLPFIIIPLLYLGLIQLFHSMGNKINPKIIVLIVFVFGGLNFVIANNDKPVYQNKLHFLICDIIRSKKEEALLSESHFSSKKEYPLEKPAEDTKDVLSPFFNIHQEKPNIVFIIMEGLGSDFTDDGEYSGFTPYLDSLISKSLYWENFVSNAGRTFGALPALMGSLPFGKNGFMELNTFPKHNSLISILKSNGYTTSYYCGDDITFDKKSAFLEHNGIDNIIDVNKFGPGYSMAKKNSGGFSWGYPDTEIYRKTLFELNHKNQPRLDIIMTLSNHEPFEFPSKNNYLKKVETILNSKSYFERNKLKDYTEIFASLLYTDNSLQKFMEDYSKRPDYANTIFIITGDHRLIPIPQKDNLSRFHVPFYIYSPMLKKTAKFKSISSHNDVTPSLVSFLTHNYKINKLEKTYWVGQGIDTTREFRNIHSIPLMRYKGSLIDYIYKDYFYTDGNLYKIDSNFNIIESNDDILNSVTASFNESKNLNTYLTTKNKITPISAKFKSASYVFTSKEMTYIKKVSKGLNSDQIFLLARKLALNKEHVKARLLCDYVLNNKPNYVDFRILKGRTFAWDGDYKNAEIELLEAINRMPFYQDGYSALMDVYFWSDQNKKAIKIGKQALSNKINDPEISFKLAKSYQRVKNKLEATKQIDSLLSVYPENQEYLKFKKSLQ
ncbi:sulfatase-like hydrolase/transferase [Flavobacterium granuli]|uniref:Tetratricopeptide (TPR) repeat protein n=1 Tax=Flavobacterium granuli TaxID=280093 RepID=A0ABU1RXT9_9FLAO|nr:sulfatase-like hydrolase/transferase [Flavobacterium granuli]MDR6843569.1 tetratricopeptide (TPR) repeat protein [Flavobacterium granuli]